MVGVMHHITEVLGSNHDEIIFIYIDLSNTPGK